YLRLRGGEEEGAADRALELEAYNRSTTQAPINVTFLSGSQRFRVAVSLALGLGQYASRQHRPIESVIIHEGSVFLVRQGRPGPAGPAGDDPGAAKPARPAALHPAGVAPGGVRRRLRRRLPVRAGERCDARQEISALSCYFTEASAPYRPDPA